MAKASQPRGGSLQYWPRKRAERFIPSVNWNHIKTDKKGLMGIIAYKVGMASCYVKDLTANSLTKDKKIVIASSVLEIPPMRIFSVRFYKNGKVMKDVLAENLDKELKRVVKLPKKKHSLEGIKDYDDIRVIVYSRTRDTGIKKTPDLSEIAISGTLDEKLNFIKDKLNKEIFASEVLKELKLVDVRGLTKGKGLVGPVTRFGIKERQHKSEKGVRRPGTLGPWHPAHVQFRVPMAGQLGLFTRVTYNSKIISFGRIGEKNINPKGGWTNFGNIKTEFLVLDGSVQGPRKRQLLLTMPLRPNKAQNKKNYEFIQLM